MRIPCVIIGGVKTACLSRKGLSTLMLADCLEARARPRAPKLVFSVNGNSIARAAADPAFRRAYAEADLIHADGQPVVLASRLLTPTPIPERSATTDYFHDAAKTAAAHGLSFYLLGGTGQVNAAAAAEMQRLYPGLRIAGRRDGYFARADEEAVCADINSSGADIVWIGLGVPLEQDFAVRNRARLKAGWLVTCGGCFNFVTGDYARAPGWMQRVGLEWLFRVLKEPRRLFWRYALTNPRALYMILTRSRAVPA